MSVKVVSFESQFLATLTDHLASNLRDGIDLYDLKLKESIAIQGPPRSVPGESPHKDTGYLHDQSLSTVVDAKQLAAQEGSDAPYSVYLEISMNREFFVPTLLDQADPIARELCKP